jgi:hypothetical protein
VGTWIRRGVSGSARQLRAKMLGYCIGGVEREGRSLLGLAAVAADGSRVCKLEGANRANALGKSVETLKKEFYVVEFEIDVLKIERSPAVCKLISKRSRE